MSNSISNYCQSADEGPRTKGQKLQQNFLQVLEGKFYKHLCLILKITFYIEM